MARPKAADGRRNGISAKFSDAELAEINEARGAKAAGTWLREAALAYLRASRRKPPVMRGQQVVVPRPEPKPDPGPPPPQR